MLVMTLTFLEVIIILYESKITFRVISDECWNETMYYYVGHFRIVIKPQHAQKVVAYKSFWTQWSKNFIQREHFFFVLLLNLFCNTNKNWHENDGKSSYEFQLI